MPRALGRVLTAALLAVVMNGAPAVATWVDEDAREEGRCGRGIAWRMEATADDGRIEVKVKIETGRTGRRWFWVLTHNGSLSGRGASRTRGGSGSFEVERTAVDLEGADVFGLRATRRAVVCVARVTL